MLGGTPMRCSCRTLDFWRMGPENLQGKGVPTNLQHPLWSGYHKVREDSKTEEYLGGLGVWALASPLVYGRAWSHVCFPYHVWKSAHILATCLGWKGECGLGEQQCFAQEKIHLSLQPKIGRPEQQQQVSKRAMSLIIKEQVSSFSTERQWTI